MQEPRERGCQAPWPIHTQMHFFLGDFPQIREWPRQLPPAAGDLLPLQRCQQLVDHKGSWEVRRGPRMPGQSLPLPGWTRPSGSVLLCVCSSSLEALTPALCSVCSFLHKPSKPPAQCLLGVVHCVPRSPPPGPSNTAPSPPCKNKNSPLAVRLHGWRVPPALWSSLFCLQTRS